MEDGSYFGADNKRTLGHLIDRFLEAELDRYSPREQVQKVQQLKWWKDRIGTLRFIHVRTKPRSHRKLPRPKASPADVARRLRSWIGVEA